LSPVGYAHAAHTAAIDLPTDHYFHCGLGLFEAAAFRRRLCAFINKRRSFVNQINGREENLIQRPKLDASDEWATLTIESGSDAVNG
jgi:hypothetical protein